MKILIVDDEALIRDGIEKRIIKYGYHPEKIVKAMDARTAGEILEKEDMDVVFVDINMPFMNGLSFIEKYAREGIYFVIISGYDRFEYAKKAIELKVVRYLLKPIDKQEFIQTMDELTQKIDGKMRLEEYSTNVKMILDCIQKNCSDGNFSLSVCASLIQLSESTISKLIKKEIGMNFNDALNFERIELAKQMLAKSDHKVKVSELAKACGFSSQQYFSVVFKKYTQKTPTQYQG